MNYLIENFGLLGGWALSALFLFVRYLFIAGVFFLFFYVFKKRRFIKRKIQEKWPEWRQSWYEVGHSLSTAWIFALVGLVIYGMKAVGWTAMYTSVGEYGVGYFVFTFLLLVTFHDTWFYWMHRAIHQPDLFKIIHKVHHQSHNPTPWAAFSFHPLEAFLEIGFLPIIVCVLPLHPLAIVMFSLWSILFNVMGHLGYEVFPKGFTQHPIFKWFNTPTHHNLHHQRSNCNYGLYFNFWDRVMQTNHKKYHEIFDEISGR